jgi:predicted ribonuclease YlaK
MGAILTRAGHKCKVVVLGDYKQVHDPVETQGLTKLVNSSLVQASPLVAVVELQKCERGELATLMSEVFEG